jgi:hypothetical protein
MRGLILAALAGGWLIAVGALLRRLLASEMRRSAEEAGAERRWRLK